MSIVFAALVPHSPVLLERIGKRHRKKMNATMHALTQLEHLLYAALPQTLAIITPHGAIAADQFSLSVADQFRTNFEQFGDFTPSATWRADAATAQQLRSACENGAAVPPLGLLGETVLDYGVAVPLELVASHLPQVAVLPVHVSGLPVAEHWRFGVFLGRQFSASSRRVAVLASGDLSHRLAAKSPAGFSPRGAAFDRAVLELVRRCDAPAVVKLEAALVADAVACGYLPLVTLLGVLDQLPTRPEVLSYEGPLGVGLLTAHFALGQAVV